MAATTKQGLVKRFDSLLIANRGEIAMRVIRTARAMGIKTIAVYSQADSDAPHVLAADDAVLIGPAPVGQSYLCIDAIVAAAHTSGAQAIHPGYGFLSENAGFARACSQAGLVFVGPGIDAIELMGDKATAKRRMSQAGVACLPGYEGEDQTESVLANAAQNIGFPVMIKATAGGGGRGMRLVNSAAEFALALAAARTEARNAFGADSVIIEKAVSEPHHVEIQVFADAHGNVIHLGERDCSVQRRHQKVVEEAPCIMLTPDLRQQMGEMAEQAARSIEYLGAGTVEFLLDRSGQFYFLEMNTRLQVEHPVTEMVTGLDLVEMQLRIARGEALALKQSDVTLRGHAIEARLYAEDPAANFLPSTGVVSRWLPASGAGVRIDSGIATNSRISPYYDPMVAKVIAWGEDREQARLRLVRALSETQLFGVTTNRGFLIEILNHEEFVRGQATTAFIGQAFTPQQLQAGQVSAPDLAIASVLFLLADRDHAQRHSIGVPGTLLNWSSGSLIGSEMQIQVSGVDTVHRITVLPQVDEHYQVWINEQAHEVTVLARDNQGAKLIVDARRHQVSLAHLPGGRLQLDQNARLIEFVSLKAGAQDVVDNSDGRRVIAPMHGVLVEILVTQGQVVAKGDRLVVLEAMKMQHDIRAAADGRVAAVLPTAGAQVADGELLIEIEFKD